MVHLNSPSYNSICTCVTYWPIHQISLTNTHIGELLGLSVCNASKVQNQTRVSVHSGTHDIDIDYIRS